MRGAPTLLALAVVCLPAGTASAQVAVSPDIDVVLDAVTFSDEAVAEDDLAGTTLPLDLGALPPHAAVTAYHRDPGDVRLFALDVPAELPGPLTVRPSDVVRYDGSGYAIELDTIAAGTPEGVHIDALSRSPGGDLLLSFDTTLDFGAFTAFDDDLVAWDGAVFTLVFDASAQGVAEALDLDAAHDTGDGRLAVSFDGSGNVGGIDFDDEDVLIFDPGGPSWVLAYDGSAEHAALPAADVEAVLLPEPSGLPQLVAGGAAFLTLARSRRRRRAGQRG